MAAQRIFLGTEKGREFLPGCGHEGADGLVTVVPSVRVPGPPAQAIAVVLAGEPLLCGGASRSNRSSAGRLD